MRLALYGGTFNPPGEHHRLAARALAEHVDQVVVVPCGPRPDKPVTHDVPAIHRAAMVDMTFRREPRTRVELRDLEVSRFTPHCELERRLAAEGNGGREVWHAVEARWLRGGAAGQSPIQASWQEGPSLWREGRFLVLRPADEELDPRDLPPHCQVIDLPAAPPNIRDKVFHHQPIDGLVTPEVAAYLERHRLYRGGPTPLSMQLRLDEVRALVFADPRSQEALALAEAYRRWEHPDPNVILVIGGDGTMLHAIREHWRLRLPFYGVNTGHMGFLLNDLACHAEHRPGHSERGPGHSERSEESQAARREALRCAQGDNSPEFARTDLVVAHMPLLYVETVDAAGQWRTALAFNDAWVERETGQTAWIEVKVGGEVRLPKLVADGALVATAAGSTAYAHAMGATPVPLNSPVLTLVGSNVLRPHQWRPVVLPLGAEIELRSLDPGKRPLHGYIDGVSQGIVRSLRARVSHIAAAELLFHPRHDPAVKLARIQFPPLDERE
jgi:NAD kinase